MEHFFTLAFNVWSYRGSDLLFIQVIHDFWVNATDIVFFLFLFWSNSDKISRANFLHLNLLSLDKTWNLFLLCITAVQGKCGIWDLGLWLCKRILGPESGASAVLMREIMDKEKGGRAEFFMFSFSLVGDTHPGLIIFPIGMTYFLFWPVWYSSRVILIVSSLWLMLPSL